MPYSPKLAWSATAEYLFDVGSMRGQVGAVYRWVGDRVNDTTERQRVTAPGDPSTILDEQITAPMELDSYGALDLYAGFGKDAWSVRAKSEEHTSELQSLMRNSYAVFCLNK